MVLATGFVLGIFRVLILVPHIGERWAELAEMPVMATAIFVAAGYMLRHFPEAALPGRSLAADLLAFTLMVVIEMGLTILFKNQTPIKFISNRDKVPGSVYIALLIVFAIMPRLRLPAHQSAHQQCDKT